MVRILSRPRTRTITVAVAVLVGLIGASLIVSLDNRALAQGSRGPTSTHKVTVVVDGDTFDVSPNIAGRDRVRMIAVDTPEVYNVESPERCANEASAFTKRVLTGERVRLELDEERIDPNDRALAYVRFPGDSLYNLRLVSRGLASVTIYEPNDRYEAQLRAAERRAKAANLGVWGGGPCDVSGSGQAPPSRGNPRSDGGEDRPIVRERHDEGRRDVTTPRNLPKQLPDTGGLALLPVTLLAGSSLMGLSVLKRSRR